MHLMAHAVHPVVQAGHSFVLSGMSTRIIVLSLARAGALLVFSHRHTHRTMLQQPTLCHDHGWHNRHSAVRTVVTVAALWCALLSRYTLGRACYCHGRRSVVRTDATVGSLPCALLPQYALCHAHVATLDALPCTRLPR